MDRSITMYYMYKDTVSAKIVVNPPEVWVENYTEDLVKRPFGVFEKPTFQQFKDFLESRCFPKTRFNCRQLLQDADLDCYNPFQIVQLTHGAMSDDVFWIRFEGENLTWSQVNPRVLTADNQIK